MTMVLQILLPVHQAQLKLFVLLSGHDELQNSPSLPGNAQAPRTFAMKEDVGQTSTCLGTI